MGKDRGGRGRRSFQSRPYNKNNWRGQKREHSKRSNDDRPKQPRNRGPQQKCTLLENQVGITEFTNADIPGFTAILKSRFSDFHVNEIDTEGHVLQLNDTKVPKVEIEPVDQSQLDEWREKLSNVIDENVWQQIADLSVAKYDPKCEQNIDVNVTSLDKEQRTQIHHLVKQLYKDKLVSKTLDKAEQQVPDGETEEKKIIRILKPKPGRSDNRWNFPHDFVTFLVHKTNMDTSEVAATIANRLTLRASQVNYCGTKDKRAKTTQQFSIKRRTPEAIANAVRGMHNVYIGNFSFRPNTLKLGDLKGNRFRIALRHITEPQESIELALQSLKERGFINYYGLQRFGNSATVPTYEVGVALLKRDYKLACELILKPRDNDVEFMREIRESWWQTRDSAAAAAKFYNNKFIEKKLLDGLATYGENDYAAALRRIPRNMLLLYPHAFQSLVFNRIASRRIKEFGLKLIPGDLVYVEDDIITEEPATAIETEEPVEDDLNGEDESLLEEESIFKRKVKALTAEDIASGKYKLSDVVMPLPGYDITYPNNECAGWYEEMLAEVGLTSELLRHKEKTYALGGAYRKLLIDTADLTWSFRRYSTPEDTLIASDWEQLKNIQTTPEPSESEAKYTALLLEFTLPTAVYATMFLRELFKQDTSTATQMQLEKEEIKKTLTQESSTIADEEIVSEIPQASETIADEAQPQPN